MQTKNDDTDGKGERDEDKSQQLSKEDDGGEER